MTETTETANPAAHGAEYDHHFTEMTLPQLWDCAVTAEHEYDRRKEAWEIARVAFDAIRESSTDPAALGYKAALQEAYAHLRGCQAAADEQGRMVTAVNRAIRRQVKPCLP